jgi:transposase
LALTDPGFDSSVLSEFRARLLAGGAEWRLFETLLEHLKGHGLVKPRGRQRTDSTHVLAAIQVLSRLEAIGETLRHALNTLATVAPDWLKSWVPSVWFDRYGQRFQEYRLPDGRLERERLAEQIGADGHELLEAIYRPDAPTWLREIPAVQILRRVWLQQFYAEGPARWRKAEDLPPAPLLISSPYDPDARYSRKRETEWTGYKIHLTETCDADTPNLITDVATAPAPSSDNTQTAAIQKRLAARGLPPSEHIVDTSYVTAAHLVSSQAEHDCTLLGPAAEDYSWQARAGQGFGSAQFVVDWEAQRATCPQGKTSQVWKPTQDTDGHPVINIRFAHADCRDCPVRGQCVASHRSRSLTIRERAEYEALQASRQRQKTAEFRKGYASRAGIEGTNSEGVRVLRLRRSRYRGFAKTALGHLLIATALNFRRVAAWLAEVPRSQTRRSAFAKLAPAGP